MDEKLKYRLVGAAVILALMAFFLPLILDSKKYKTEIVSQIPPMPEAQTEAGQSDKPVEQGPLVIELDKDLETLDETNEKVPEVKPELAKEAAQASSDEEKTASAQVDSSEKLVTKQNESKSQSEKSTQQEEVIEKPKLAVIKGDTATATDAKPSAEAIKAASESSVEKAVIKQSPKEVAPDFKEAAYLVQIGSFSNKDNASKLVSDLRKQDYRAYQRVSADFSRVFVGPYPDKSIAESRSAALAKIVGNKVKVIEFDPIKH